MKLDLQIRRTSTDTNFIILTMETIINEIRRELENNSDIKTKEGGQRFFKEQVRFYGVKTSVVSKISKEYFKSSVKKKTKAGIFDLCDKLWQSGYMEESFIACSWSYFIRKDYTSGDFNIFKKWLDTYVNNWASCDTLCNHTIGAFIEMYPEYFKPFNQIRITLASVLRMGSTLKSPLDLKS